MKATDPKPDHAPKIADAYKSWGCFLLAIMVAVSVFRRSLPAEVIAANLAVTGLIFGVRALRRGPLKMLGGIFLILNAFVLLSVVTLWFGG